MIIDNHGHIGNPDTFEIVGGYPPGEWRGLTHEKFLPLMDAVGVDVAVLHTGRTWGNDYHRRVMTENPTRFISVCNLDENDAYTDESLAKLRMYVEDWGFRGLYFDPHLPEEAEPFYDFHKEKYGPLWTTVRELDVPVCFVSYAENYDTLWPGLLSLLDRYPELTVVITHGLHPGRFITEDNKAVIPESVLELVKTYDVYLDLRSGHRKGNFGPNDEGIKALYDAFGPSKLLWGTEFSKVDNPTADQYAYQLDYLERRCAYITKGDLQLILGGNARKVYRIRDWPER